MDWRLKSLAGLQNVGKLVPDYVSLGNGYSYLVAILQDKNWSPAVWFLSFSIRELRVELILKEETPFIVCEQILAPNKSALLSEYREPMIGTARVEFQQLRMDL